MQSPTIGERPSLQARLVEVWTWLPAFRAVAELQHVQGAARMLHVTASSLSRAIGLLEDRLGKRLFDRVGRNVRLNHEGQELLVAVREAMRTIDDGMARITGTAFAGEIRVSCEGDQPIAFAWRAAARLMEKHGDLRTTVEATSERATLPARLLRGEIDVAIVTTAGDTKNLLVEALGELSYGIYCGVGHALYKRTKPSLKEICEHPFVAPTSSGKDGVHDQWPAALARDVKLRLPALEPAIAACASGELLAVLPDLAVAEARERHTLRRLPSEAIPRAPLVLLQRRPTAGGVSRVAAFVDELRLDVAARLSAFDTTVRGPNATRPRGRSRSPAAPSRRGAR